MRLGKLGFAEYDGERAGRYAAAAENADQRTRIDAPGKKHSHRHVANQLQAYGFLEERPHLIEGGSFLPRNRSRCSCLPPIDHFPIRGLTKSSVFPSQSVTGRKRANSFHEREWIVSGAECQVVDEPGMVNPAGHEARAEQRPNFRRKEKIRTRLCIVKRLDAHGIAGHEQAMLPGVPDGEGKHPAKLCHTLLTPARVRFQHNFRVGVANKRRPA